MLVKARVGAEVTIFGPVIRCLPTDKYWQSWSPQHLVFELVSRADGLYGPLIPLTVLSDARTGFDSIIESFPDSYKDAGLPSVGLAVMLARSGLVFNVRVSESSPFESSEVWSAFFGPARAMNQFGPSAVRAMRGEMASLMVITEGRRADRDGLPEPEIFESKAIELPDWFHTCEKQLLLDDLDSLEERIGRCRRDRGHGRENEKVRQERIDLTGRWPFGFDRTVEKSTVTDMNGRSDRTIIGLAAVSKRFEILEANFETYLNNSDKIYLYLDDQKVPPSFAISEKVKVTTYLDTGRLGPIGKLLPFAHGERGFVFLLDDDIDIPRDYFCTLREWLEVLDFRAAVCVHGSRFGRDAESYYERCWTANFQGALEHGELVDLPGSGTFAAHTDSLEIDFAAFFPHMSVDLNLAQECARNGVPIVAVPREGMWLRNRDDGLWQEMSGRPLPQDIYAAGGFTGSAGYCGPSIPNGESIAKHWTKLRVLLRRQRLLSEWSRAIGS